MAYAVRMPTEHLFTAYCTPMLYSTMRFGALTLLPERKIPQQPFPPECSQGDFPAVRLCINRLLIHQRAISGIAHELHIKGRDLLLLIYFTCLFEISIF